MNIQTLKYFVALANLRHFGKTSKVCFTTQPTISIQIKNMEKELGVHLFERNNKRVLLTPIGEKLLGYAQRILNEIDHMRVIAEQEKDLFASEITLGIIPTICPYILPLLLPVIQEKYPRLKLSFIEDKTEPLLQKLEDGSVDAVIIASSVDAKGVEITFLGKEDFFLAVSESHPLSKKKSITHEDVQKQNVLLLEEGHCLRDQIINYCRSVKSKESTKISATSLETLLGMISSGFVGVTLVPKLAKKSRSGIVFLPFKTSPPERAIQMIWRKSSVKKLLLQTITEEVMAFLTV